MISSEPLLPMFSSFVELGYSETNIGFIFFMSVCTYVPLGALWLAFRHFEGQLAMIANLRIALLCLTFAAMSIGMHVVNKALVVLLGAPAIVAGVQMLIAVLAMLPFTWKELVEVDCAQMRTWLIVPAFFAAMLLSSAYGYQYISLSILTLVRNLAPLVVLPIEMMCMPPEKRPKVTKLSIASILIMLAGAIVYGRGVGTNNLSFIGIAIAFTNMIVACSDRMIQRRLLSVDCKDLPLGVCTIVNNSCSIVPAIALAMFSNEISKPTTPLTSHFHAYRDPRVIALWALSGAIGLGICYFGFACQREISATSFMILQNVSKIFVVSLGIVVFEDPFDSPLVVLGLAMSIGGSVAYGSAQMSLSQDEKTEKQQLLTKDADEERA